MMRKIRPLTQKQREFAEEYHDYIFQYLRCRHLAVQDFYDSAVFGYLLAVQEYLEKPDIQKYGFRRIAYTSMRSAIADEQRRQYRQKQLFSFKEFSEESLDGFLPDRQQYIAETLDNQNDLLQLLSCMTPKEKEVVYLKADGFTYQEIAQRCNISMQGVGSRFYRLRQKLRRLEREECL